MDEYIDAISAFIASPAAKARALAAVAERTGRPGEYVRNRRLLEMAEKAAFEIADPAERARLITDIAEAAIGVADDERVGHAVDLVIHIATTEVADTRARVNMMVRLAQAFVEQDDGAQVARLLGIARQLACAAPAASEKGGSLAFICRRAVGTGHLELAESIARSISHTSWRSAALTSVAAGAWRSKDHRLARQLIKDAEQAAVRIVSPTRMAIEFTHIARVAVLAHDGKTVRRLLREAEGAAARSAHADAKSVILAEAARTCASMGDTARAQQLIGEACAVLPDIADRLVTDAITANLVRYAMEAGLVDDAERIALSMRGPYPQYYVLSRLAAAVADGSHDDRATILFERAISAAAKFIYPKTRLREMAYVVKTAAESGLHDLAERSAVSSRSLGAVARVASNDGRLDDAERLVRMIQDSEIRWRELANLARAAEAAGEPARSERAVLEAFRDGAELLPVDVIVTRCPPAVAVLTATLEEIRGHGTLG